MLVSSNHISIDGGLLRAFRLFCRRTATPCQRENRNLFSPLMTQTFLLLLNADKLSNSTTVRIFCGREQINIRCKLILSKQTSQPWNKSSVSRFVCSEGHQVKRAQLDEIGPQGPAPPSGSLSHQAQCAALGHPAQIYLAFVSQERNLCFDKQTSSCSL